MLKIFYTVISTIVLLALIFVINLILQKAAEKGWEIFSRVWFRIIMTYFSVILIFLLFL